MKVKFMRRKPVTDKREIKLPKLFAANLEEAPFKKYASPDQLKVLKNANQEGKMIHEALADYNDEICILCANVNARIKYVEVIRAFLEITRSEQQNGSFEAYDSLTDFVKETHVNACKESMEKAGDGKSVVVNITERKDMMDNYCTSVEDITLNKLEKDNEEPVDAYMSINYTFKDPVEYGKLEYGLFMFCDKVFLKQKTGGCHEIHSGITITQFVKMNDEAKHRANGISSAAIGKIMVRPMVADFNAFFHME